MIRGKVRQPAVEHLVGEPQPLLAAELNQEQFVDGIDQNLRRDLGEHLPELRIVLKRLRADVRLHPLERRDLPLLQFCLGDDVSVDLHKDLFDHFL